jgi:uncharacterized protein
VIAGNPSFGQRWPGFFGPPERRLFGCAHPAAGSDEHDLAVVLCYPIGQEYTYSHRAYVNLANRLSQAGINVGRFDYYGTGDSAGEEDDQTVEDWLGDISTTIAEARRVTRRRHVALVGLRFGAALATLAAVTRGDIAALVLWDPVVDGRGYLEQLRVRHQEALWTLFFDRPPDEPVDGRPSELLGFRFNPRLYEEISAINLAEMMTKPARTALLIDSQGDPLVTQLGEHLQQLAVDVAMRHVPEFSIWAEDPDKGLVPTRALQTIITWLSELKL